MGSELVDRFPREGQRYNNSAFSFTTTFWEALPHYMAMGMTPDEYFNGDAQLTKAYAKAFELKKEQENYKLWLNGFYTYQSIVLSAPALNSIKPSKPLEYPNEPVDINPKRKEKTAQIEDERLNDVNYSKMLSWANKVNRKWQKQK